MCVVSLDTVHHCRWFSIARYNLCTQRKERERERERKKKKVNVARREINKYMYVMMNI